MFKKILFITFFSATIISCKSTKSIQTKAGTKSKHPEKVVLEKNTESKTAETHSTEEYYSEKTETESISNLIENLIETAKSFEGTRYKYGGTTKKGIDCSGLVTTVFNTENISLPRTTGELSVTGDWIDLKEVQKGDLLFFATRNNSRNVNHVGIVTETRLGYVEFIHASTSAGVIISSLSEKFWYFAFVQARRVI